MIIVHYHRQDKNYSQVGLWTWDGNSQHNPSKQELPPLGTDDFGPWFQLDPASYGEETSKGTLIGFLPRIKNSWKFKDGDDRFWTPELGNEIWLVSGNPIIYSSRPDVAPRIQTALLDGPRIVSAWLSHPIKKTKLSTKLFHLENKSGDKMYFPNMIRPLEEHNGQVYGLAVVLPEALETTEEISFHGEGYKPCNVVTQLSKEIGLRPGVSVEMGAVCRDSATSFRVFSPSAHSVHAVVYHEPVGPKGRTVYALDQVGRGFWETEAKGNLHGKYYMIYVDAGEANYSRQEVVDIYVQCATGTDSRGLIVNPQKLDPEQFRPIQRPPFSEFPTDAIIYEMHLRDFSISRDSGVSVQDRGKYLGAAKHGTVVPGTKVSTTIDHLVDLGVTHVQLLPIQDFTNDESFGEYNWGYMTRNFFSPEGWYASNPNDSSRVPELKQLIQALHKAGIRVIMDVVFNHTDNDAMFDAIAPDYYYRLMEDGARWNGSGCGNEFRSESTMGRTFIIECCRHWVEQYGVDGFRFDLMGLIDFQTLCEVRDMLKSIDPTLLIYGEPWAATGNDGAGIGHIVYKDKLRNSKIASFNDHYRNSLKGSPDGSDPGYIHDGSNREGLKRGLEGSIHDWAYSPLEVVQYGDCHDNLILWDKTAKVFPSINQANHIRIQALGIGLLAVSQGIMFLHGGVEFGRSKGGHHNSYNAPDSVNQFVWSRKAHLPELFHFTKEIIALRRNHPVFRLTSRREIANRLRFYDALCPTPESIVVYLNGEELPGESWRETLILVNPHPKDRSFPLPAGSWNVYLQGLKIQKDPLFDIKQALPVPAHGIAILAR